MKQLPIFFMAGMAALVLLAGCASQSFLGKNPAKVRVEINGWAQPSQGPETANTVSPVKWDWGFYLLRKDGSLLKLSEKSGQRTTVLEENPLKATGEFLVPAGRQTVRLLVEAYQYYWIGREPAPLSLVFFQRDYQLDLGQGALGHIKAKVGEKRPAK